MPEKLLGHLLFVASAAFGAAAFAFAVQCFDYWRGWGDEPQNSRQIAAGRGIASVACAGIAAALLWLSLR